MKSPCGLMAGKEVFTGLAVYIACRLKREINGVYKHGIMSGKERNDTPITARTDEGNGSCYKFGVGAPGACVGMDGAR